MKFIIGPLVYLFPQTFWSWTLPDEVYYRPFGLLVPTDFLVMDPTQKVCGNKLTKGPIINFIR
jgi:hypothetical protein